mmetsp:Transcript_3627/g.5291  ORF Transcript_3627/g.5291 Transcript_3627/m.5291 type:complete len:214 (+) Transcript_3627:1040-1681(+)
MIHNCTSHAIEHRPTRTHIMTATITRRQLRQFRQDSIGMKCCQRTKTLRHHGAHALLFLIQMCRQMWFNILKQRMWQSNTTIATIIIILAMRLQMVHNDFLDAGEEQILRLGMRSITAIASCSFGCFKCLQQQRQKGIHTSNTDVTQGIRCTASNLLLILLCRGSTATGSVAVHIPGQQPNVERTAAFRQIYTLTELPHGQKRQHELQIPALW